jgi:putative toxin-antitoxin system antitoxin component (TIGR02293 family)
MLATKAKANRSRARSAKARPGAGTLGIGARGPLAIVRLVRAGFPFSRLARLQKATALPWDRITRFVSIPQRTLTRRQSEGRLRPDESDRVWRASRVFDLAVGLFEGDVAGARRWLQTPQPGLGGEVPLELATTEAGAREVERLVTQLEDGVFP